MEELGWIRGNIVSCTLMTAGSGGEHGDAGSKIKNDDSRTSKRAFGLPVRNRGRKSWPHGITSDRLHHQENKWENNPELPMPTEGIAMNPKRLPYNVNLDLRNTKGEGVEEDLSCRKSLAGDLLWITRPEISFIVKELARASSDKKS